MQFEIRISSEFQFSENAFRFSHLRLVKSLDKLFEDKENYFLNGSRKTSGIVSSKSHPHPYPTHSTTTLPPPHPNPPLPPTPTPQPTLITLCQIYTNAFMIIFFCLHTEHQKISKILLVFLESVFLENIFHGKHVPPYRTHPSMNCWISFLNFLTLQCNYVI